MRTVLARLALAALVVAIAIPAAAFDLGHQAPAKPTGSQQAPTPDPEVIRQGGDTFLDAVLLDQFPVIDVIGTTVGYTDDYDEVCPYEDSTSPDVVYRLAFREDHAVDIDMHWSTYDTKIYVYREDLTLVACNDDFYPDFVSKLENVLLEGDVKYFLVIDGWGGNSGDYVLNIVEFDPCVLDCPSGAQIEGEPPLGDDYQDAYNGGCNSPEFGNPFGYINSWAFCGRSGWYLNAGVESRDTDWFRILIPYDGFLEIIGDAEYPTYMCKLEPQDCDAVAVVQNITIGPCAEGTMVIPGAVGSTVWFWVGPTTFTGPVTEYTYVLRLNLFLDLPVATETATWTSVRGLFR